MKHFFILSVTFTNFSGVQTETLQKSTTAAAAARKRARKKFVLFPPSMHQKYMFFCPGILYDTG